MRLGSLDLSGSITISGAGYHLKNLIIENTSKYLTLSIENLVAENIYLTRYRNEKGLRFSNLKAFGINSEFAISNSYLGKAEFYSVNFASFSQVNILNSFITDSVFVNTNFKYLMY